MDRNKVVRTVDHGTRVVNDVEVRIEQECWLFGGSSFSVIRVSDDTDLTQEVHGQCFDEPPTDEQIANLLERPEAAEQPVLLEDDLLTSESGD